MGKGKSKAEAELRKVRDRAARAYARGAYDRALENFEILARDNPGDLRLQMKCGEILLKLRKKDDALKRYEDVALAYSRDGFLIQAISVYKLILQEDPNRAGIQERIQELNQSRSAPAKKLDVLLKAKAKPVVAEEEEKEEGVPEAAPAEEAEKPRFEFPPTPLFSELGTEEFEAVVAKFQVGQIPKGTMVIKEGTRGDAFFVIGSGEVRVFRTLPSGRKVTLARLSEGEFFGEMAFFLESVRTASIETTSETTLLRISRDDLAELMEAYPNVKEVIENFFKERALDTIFKTTPFFESLEEWEQEDVVKEFQMEVMEPGTLIVKEGDPGRYLYFIFKGAVDLVARHEQKGEVKVTTLGEGEYFGEVALLQAQTHPTEAVAAEKTVLFKLPAMKFTELIQIHSPMLEELSIKVDERMKLTVEALTE
jgi:cAMP-dependent protein kinase regulator